MSVSSRFPNSKTSEKYARCIKAHKCWIKDCLYSKIPKSYTAPDGRRVSPRRVAQLFRYFTCLEMSEKSAKCTKTQKCWIEDCLYNKRKSHVGPDRRRIVERQPVQLFRFPPEPDRYATWVEAVGPMLLDRTPGRLCKYHFCDADFLNGTVGDTCRLILKRDAVPSLSHDYARRPPGPVKPKVEPTNIRKMFKNVSTPKRKSPTATMRKCLGLSDEESDESDSDSDVDKMVESELGFKLERDEEDYQMLSDDDDDFEVQPMTEGEVFDDDENSDEDVQIELIKLMAKKARGASPQPSPHFEDDHSPPPDSSGPSAAGEDATTKLFRSVELIYRSLQPEVQLLTKENLLGVMEMAEKMDADLKKNSRLVLKPRVFSSSGNKR